MNEKAVIEAIADKNVDIDTYVKQVLEDAEMRKLVLKNLLTSPEIMVYYHCYYIISKASEMEPSLFYGYWDAFLKLLSHKNSYHRDIGLTILANLTAVDSENRFSYIYDDYMALLNDPKFMTAECCLKNLKKILDHKPDYEESVINRLISIPDHSPYTEKQEALMVSLIIDVFDGLVDHSPFKEDMINFVRQHKDSISPKTRKRAKMFLTKGD